MHDLIEVRIEIEEAGDVCFYHVESDVRVLPEDYCVIDTREMSASDIINSVVEMTLAAQRSEGQLLLRTLYESNEDRTYLALIRK